MPINNLIQFRKGSSSDWASQNPILSSGEPGYDFTNNVLKVGDGLTQWSGLNPVNLSGIYFNNAVSGLLPVKNIVAGSDISVSSISGIYTISNTMTSVETSASVVTTVFNKTGASIPKMAAVYINGGQGDLPTIQKALATADISSAGTYGITYEAIDNMSSGRVIVLGALTGLNTDQFNPTAPMGDVNGTVLYLSPTVSGALTTTKPYAPYHIVALGTIVRTHQNAGVIEVRVQNGYELEELHNVAVTGATNGQFLQYNSISGLWIPSSSGNFSTLQVNGTAVPTGTGINSFVTTWDGTNSIGSSKLYHYYSSLDDQGYLSINGSGISSNTLSMFTPNAGDTKLYMHSTYGGAYIVQAPNDPYNPGNLWWGISSVESNGNATTWIGSRGDNNALEKVSIYTKASGVIGNPIERFTVGVNGLVINDTSNNFDVRIEGDTDANLFFTDASVDRVGIGTSSPSYKLDVIGTGNFSQNLLVNNTGVSLSGHTHSSSQITDFNSSVSGLLPVKNIIAGTGISISSDNGNYTINSTSSGGAVSAEDVMDIIGTGIVAGTGLSVSYNDNDGNLTINLYAVAITGYEILTTAKDTFTVTPNYLVGNLQVYYNGFKLLDGEDYTATNGTSFLLSSPGASGDVVEWAGLGGPAQYAQLNHTHTISDITNFGSGVTGLLPTIANSGNNRVLTSTGSSTGINAESNFTFDGTSLSHHAGNFANAGDAQHTILVARRTTTDSTADVVLTLDGNTPGASNRPTIPAQSVWTFSLKLSAYNDTDSLGAWWIIRGGIRRNGANGTALVGSLVVENDSEGAMSGTSATVVADDTNEALEIRVTGLSSKNIRWVGVLDISQVSYGTP